MIWDHRIAAERVANRVLELVRCRGGTRAAKIFVPVINSAVIHELTVQIEDRAFRSDGRALTLHQFATDVAQRWNRQMKLLVVRANAGGGFVRVRINQPKISFAMKFFMQLLN